MSLHHVHRHRSVVENEVFYVNSSSCRIPKTNPFASDIMKYFKRHRYKECDKDKDIVSRYFDKELGQYRLRIHQHHVSCSYQVIGRVEKDSSPDNTYSLSPPKPLTQNFLVPQDIDYMTIKCYDNDSHKLLQEDAFLFVQDRVPINQTERDYSSDELEPKPNVIILGIDSISRMNLQRSMPKVHKFLQQQGWFEMQGYNKVGDNTLPNLLAILTGNAEEQAMAQKEFSRKGSFDKLNFIWKRYKKSGYVTAYGEDCQGISTFNFEKPGFVLQPVDYYLRNFMLAMEKTLKKVRRFRNIHCIGRRLASSYVWDLLRQLMERYQNAVPLFGLFWSNSFTHNDFTGATALDTILYAYLLVFEAVGLFDQSIVLVLSDHGDRFGVSRTHSKAGYLEERLPMMFIYVPLWFRQKYPEYVDNLKLNRNRLSSNYDLHMTLHHILELSTSFPEDFDPRLQAENCKECRSLFFELPEKRNCSQAGIPEKWCSCHPTTTVTNKNRIDRIAKRVVRHMNQHLRDRNLTDLCQKFKSVQVQHLDRKQPLSEEDHSAGEDPLSIFYVITFAHKDPHAMFEATVEFNIPTQSLLMNVDELSRLDSYKDTGQCVNDPIVKKCCLCIE